MKIYIYIYFISIRSVTLNIIITLTAVLINSLEQAKFIQPGMLSINALQYCLFRAQLIPRPLISNRANRHRESCAIDELE